MQAHLENIQHLYGNCIIRLPNNIFRTLSTTIKSKSGKTNSQQIAFSYVYLITVGFLYKYAHYVDVDNATYLQNSDIKELLGYSKTTKSIDKIIKRNGVLDELGLTATTKDYPIGFHLSKTDSINNIPLREFQTISEADDRMLDLTKRIVKNRNYETKEPLYMTKERDDNEYGTLYGIEKTHDITIRELMAFLFDEEMDCLDFLIYGFIKSRCKGYQYNMKSMTIYKMVAEIGIDRSTFYNRLPLLKERQYIAVTHKKWKSKKDEHIPMEANDYYWLGV